MKRLPVVILLVVALLVTVVAGCGGMRRHDARLTAADSLMQSDPDSALAIVEAVCRDSLASEGDRAYRDLLLTQARYRCYIPATSDSDISRALAWYRAHDSEREKLTRALIYKGAVMEELSRPDSAMLLQYRPDVKMADYAMASAYYDTQAARAAFYPSISLQGLAGWTNNAGGAVVNPGKILLNAMASLTQPIYAQGKLKANLKISQLAQEDLMNKYVQTVINAGNEVNEALADCQAAIEKHDYYHRQVEVLKDAYRGTHELMDNGKAIYLEVLTAQETLLNAQLNEAINMYNGAQGIIALYIALGGATR